MKKTNMKVVSASLLLSVMLSLGATAASAAVVTPNSLGATNISLDVNGRVYKHLKSVANKNVWSYTRPAVTIGNKTLSVNGIIINGVVYIPFRQAASAIAGSSYSYDSSTKTSTMKANGLEITAGNGCYVTYANGRALFSTTPNVIMSDGRMYIPVTVFAKAVGMKVDATTSKISIAGSFKPLLHADKFYNNDEVFWLARIIHAESRGEALIGQVAVGNVVLNRVKSAYYPNTIYGVIFDRKYGVQFSPVLDGSIYNTPTYNATLAAKICLEGTKLSQHSLFFLNPITAESSWIIHSREYLYSIGGHDFYS